MTVNVSKPAINVREKLAELDKPTGIAGEAMLRAETPQEQFNLIGAGRRNLVINGDMRIAQRGGSATSVSGNNNTYVLDRFFSRINGTNGAATVEQSTDAPDLFSNSLKFTVTTADTSLSAGHYNRVHQEIEGYNIVGLGWGTSSAKPITLSFWVKSSVTGIYSIGIYNGAVDRSFVQEYTIDAANTWEQKVITVIGPTDGVWAVDNSAELRLSFSLGTGTTYDTNGLGYWQNAFNFGSTNNVNLMATLNATWQITGVQLELGKVATPFEHRSYGEELALCQRYYTRWDVATNWSGYQNGTSIVDFNVYTPVPMRNGSPSLSCTGSFYVWRQNGYQQQNAPAIGIGGGGTQFHNNAIYCQVGNFSGLINGYIANVFINSLEVDDEL
jgi:hypothetical protein